MKNVEEYEQQDNTESAQYISKQANIQRVPMLCINEASRSGLTGSGTQRQWYRWNALRKVMLGAGVVVAALLPGLSTADKPLGSPYTG